MALSYLVIDGYNLLHAAGLSRVNYGPGDYERVRFALLIRIADGLDDAARERATVVFDAFDPPPDATRRFRFREMSVEFAVEGGEADARIEELIRKHSSPRQLRVVSDDVRLQKAAKRRGASAVKCEAFLRRLDRFAAPSASLSGHPDGGATQVGTADDWLSYFGMEKGDAANDVARLVKEDQFAGDRQADSSSPAAASPKRHTLSPAKHLPPAVRTTKAEQRSRKPPVSQPDDETPVEDLSFWQRRIEEALTEERRPRPHRPESS